jgi:hypothetical protein
VDTVRDHPAGADVRRRRSPLGRLGDRDIRTRDRVTWMLAGCLTLGWWGAGAWAATHGSADSMPLAGALLTGGWSLSVVPVHCARIRGRIARPPRRGGRGAKECSLCAAAESS